MPGLDKQTILQHLEAEARTFVEFEEANGMPHDTDAAYRRLACVSHAIARCHTWADDDAEATLVALGGDIDAPTGSAVMAHLAGLGVGPEEVLVERARFVAEETGRTLAPWAAISRTFTSGVSAGQKTKASMPARAA